MKANEKCSAFPFELPPKPLVHAEPSFELEWTAVYKRLKERMKKLRAVARGLKDFDEDQVAYAVQAVFCNKKGIMNKDKDGNILLDVLSAAEIKSAIKLNIQYVEWKEFARFPNPVAILNAMFVTTSEWSRICRNLGIGGSDTGILSGVLKYDTSLRSVYDSKTRLPLTETDDDKAFIFEYGHEREPIVINTFCSLTGAEVIPCPFMFQHRKYRWMTANIDAVVKMPDGTLAIFEAKTTSSHAESDWKVGPPPQYLRQPMHYMAVLNDDRIKRAYIGCVVSNVRDGWYCWPIERDLAEEDLLIEREADFFNRYLKPGIPPDFTGDKDRDMLAYFTYERRIETLQTGKDVELGDNLMTTFRNWQAIDAQRQQAEAQAEALKQQCSAIALSIFETLKDDEKSAYLVDGDTGMQFVVGCRVVNKTTIDKDALRLLAPDIYAQVATTKTTAYAPAISYKRVPKKKGVA